MWLFGTVASGDEVPATGFNSTFRDLDLTPLLNWRRLRLSLFHAVNAPLLVAPPRLPEGVRPGHRLPSRCHALLALQRPAPPPGVGRLLFQIASLSSARGPALQKLISVQGRLPRSRE